MACCEQAWSHYLSWLCTLAHADSTIYSDTLTSAENEIIGIPGNPWLTGGTTFAWTVTGNTNGTYAYEYRLTAPDASKQISHVILEVSPTFASANILNVTAGTLDGSQPDSYPKHSDPGMPSAMQGIKFSAGGAGSTHYDWIVAFVSDRAPVWGDFYAVGGKKSGHVTAIWNAGFTSPDTDPTGAPFGSIGNHILVADTLTSTIPAPGALLLSSLGAGLISWLRRRRML